MAKAAKSTKRNQRSKAKPKRAVALHSQSAALRKKSRDAPPAKSAARAMPFVNANPAIIMSRSMSGFMSAFIELPARLMQCRTPFAVWREQALFAGRLFELMHQDFLQEGPPQR